MSTDISISSDLLLSPVLFLVFNRPDATKQVFETIRKARPAQLFVAADGPRENRAGEAEKCAEVRRIVDNGIDWDCKVHRLYRDKNLGCKIACSSAIDWFFKHVEEGIILEDDCLPDPTFFQFCEELLKRYRDDERIMLITGDNLLFGYKRTNYSYHFSRYYHLWGWASWKRAWRYYDREITLWPEIKNGDWLKDIFGCSAIVRHRSNILQNVYEGKIDTWDYSLAFSWWIQNGLSIIPSNNLVSNIGYGHSGTHTKSTRHRLANMDVAAMKFPLEHPPFVIRDTKSDRFVEKKIFGIPNIIFWPIKRNLGKLKTYLKSKR